MEIRKFQATNMEEALKKVRTEMGSDSIILQSSEVRKRRGLRKHRLVEVTAGVGIQIQQSEVSRASSSIQDGIGDRITNLESMLEDLCRRKKSLAPDLPQSLVPLYSGMVEADVCESVANELICELRDHLSVEECRDPQTLLAEMNRLIESRLRDSGSIVCRNGQCTVVAFVGPTGAGKTSAVAKLAARFKLEQNLRVGLLTIDTYRIAAVDQLRTYADIVDVPLKVVMAPRDVSAALQELRNLDLVLIDTVGRNPNDELRLKELNSFLAEAQPDETHLVLSAVSSPTSLQRAVERFEVLNPDRLLMTKLDETSTLGSLLSCLAAAPYPLGYVSNGQNVPEDIHVADRSALAEQVTASLREYWGFTAAGSHRSKIGIVD